MVIHFREQQQSNALSTSLSSLLPNFTSVLSTTLADVRLMLLRWLFRNAPYLVIISNFHSRCAGKKSTAPSSTTFTPDISNYSSQGGALQKCPFFNLFHFFDAIITTESVCRDDSEGNVHHDDDDMRCSRGKNCPLAVNTISYNDIFFILLLGCDGDGTATTMTTRCRSQQAHQ